MLASRWVSDSPHEVLLHKQLGTQDLKGNGRKQSTQELNVKDVVHKVQLCDYSTYVGDLEQNILHQ
jgi:hypothetical protein